MRFSLATAALAMSLATTQAAAKTKLTGQIKIDGSSTVFPITEAVSEEFQKKEKDVRVTAGISGTGGGFKKFVVGEIDIVDASRPINEKEAAEAKKNNIEFIELPIAYDGLSVVVSKSNTFLKTITMAELKKIWEKDSKVKKWSDVNPAWPKEDIKLYGPGADSGTFDYFTEVVNGKAKESRTDYSASEDDNQLVVGVKNSPNALGYFGFGYYATNTKSLRAIPIVKTDKPIEPNHTTIQDGSYPLSRPLYIYVNKKAAQRPEVAAYVDFFLANAATMAEETKFVRLPETMYTTAKADFGSRKTKAVH